VDGAPDPSSWTAKRTAIDDAGGRIGQNAKNIEAMNACLIKPPDGRYPANILHDGSDEVLEAFAAFGESGPKEARQGLRGGSPVFGQKGIGSPDKMGAWPADPGGTAARFFYCAKASKAERGEGNNHPTVKPLELMRWLVRLVTLPEGRVLDCFAGSSMTGVAAMSEGRGCVLVEKELLYAEVGGRKLEKVYNMLHPKRVNVLGRGEPC
jgi:site-specific DNA-methyltransferase (adenine-specific)